MNVTLTGAVVNGFQYDGSFTSNCGQTIFVRVFISNHVGQLCGIALSCDGLDYSASAVLTAVPVDCSLPVELDFKGLITPVGHGCSGDCAGGTEQWCGNVTW
jgi:hypothetical protein